VVKNLGKSVTLRHVRAFIAVAEQGSFTQASDILAISQPALTTTINQLEDILETPLFVRTTRRVEVTPVGQNFLPAAQRIVRDFDREIRAAYEAGKRSSNLVKIAVLPSLAMSIFPTAMMRFGEEQPNITVNIRDDNAKGVHRQVLRSESDFGISNQWEEDSQLEFTPLFQDRVGLVCHHNHPLAAEKEGINWEQLKDHSFAGMSDDTGVSALLHSMNEELPENVLSPEFEVLTMVALASIIHANLAGSALPALAIPRLVAPPLEFIKLRNPEVWRQVHIVTHKKSSLSSSAETLRDFLLKSMATPWDNLSDPWNTLGSDNIVSKEFLKS